MAPARSTNQGQHFQTRWIPVRTGHQPGFQLVAYEVPHTDWSSYKASSAMVLHCPTDAPACQRSMPADHSEGTHRWPCQGTGADAAPPSVTHMCCFLSPMNSLQSLAAAKSGKHLVTRYGHQGISGHLAVHTSPRDSLSASRRST